MSATKQDSGTLGREAATVSAGHTQFNNSPRSAAEEGTRSSKRQSLVASNNGNTRQSHAAALWNPLNEKDKLAFNRRRLIQLAAGVLVAMTAGASYAFGIFSKRIKEQANLTQSDMTMITTIGSLTSGLLFPAGMLYDYTGPRYVLIMATVFGCCAFILLALIFEGIVPAGVASVGAATCLTSLASGFFDCGSLVTNLFSFPISKGEVLIIQKTFFGLGATFLALSFDGFFGAEDNYLGYAIYVASLILVCGTLAAVVTFLPPYKRTGKELKRIANLGPVEKEAERLIEERSFEMYHNPRLLDRRRLNLGVTCLMVTFAFFSTFSITKTYVEFSSNVLTGLTILACFCMLSFFLMVAPFPIPSFFDYEFLPDIHPPEELMDKPKEKKPVTHTVVLKGDDAQSACTREYSQGGFGERAALLAQEGDGGDHDDANQNGDEGRASAFLPQRQSVAGNSAPIAVPQALAPMVIPSVTSPFLVSIRQPLVWCFWYGIFAIAGTNSVMLSNSPQIMTAANDGVYDKSLNSLIVALAGLGSACGRVLVGFGETYFHRKNALIREAQLAYLREAEEEEEGAAGAKKAAPVDMRPAYHHWNSTILCVMPLCPIALTGCVLSLTILPVGAFPAVYFVTGVAAGAFLGTYTLGIREIFSVDVAKHYKFVGSSSIFSALLLNRFMFGEWFDEVTKEHHAPDGKTCSHVKCFSGSMYVLAGCVLMSAFAMSFVIWKWWKVRMTF